MSLHTLPLISKLQLCFMSIYKIAVVLAMTSVVIMWSMMHWNATQLRYESIWKTCRKENKKQI